MSFYIDKQGKRINPYAAIEHSGVIYNGNVLQFPDVVAALGIEQVQEPEQPEDYSEITYIRTEVDEAPYVIYTRRDQSVIDEAMLAKAKQDRQAAVDAITVTTESGRVFDGDENSQDRMSRAIVSMEPGEATEWVLADNTVVEVTREELREALRLAGQRQTELWILPYSSN